MSTLCIHFHHAWKWKLWQLREECHCVWILQCEMTCLLGFCIKLLPSPHPPRPALNCFSISKTTPFIIIGVFLLFGFVLQQVQKVLRIDSINTNYINRRQYLRKTKCKDLPATTLLFKLASEFSSLDLRF